MLFLVQRTIRSLEALTYSSAPTVYPDIFRACMGRFPMVLLSRAEYVLTCTLWVKKFRGNPIICILVKQQFLYGHSSIYGTSVQAVPLFVFDINFYMILINIEKILSAVALLWGRASKGPINVSNAINIVSFVQSFNWKREVQKSSKSSADTLVEKLARLTCSEFKEWHMKFFKFQQSPVYGKSRCICFV